MSEATTGLKTVAKLAGRALLNSSTVSWKLVEEDGVQYHALVTHMYVKIYFPFAARFYMMDPLVAMKSKFDLKEKLAILLFVLEHT